MHVHLSNFSEYYLRMYNTNENIFKCDSRLINQLRMEFLIVFVLIS